jgi:outer membrane protein assembly factor BamB
MAARKKAWGIAAIAVAAVAGTLALAGYGSSGSSGGTQASASEVALVPWPLFGRVPERTHYLPARQRTLNPPLRETWSIDTHALIEFPPAVANGVAYLVNKYGNAKAVRLSDRKVLWERITDPKDSGAPTDVTAPVYHRGKVFFAYVDGSLVAVDAGTGEPAWTRKLGGHLES